MVKRKMVVSPAIYYRLIYHRSLKFLERTTIMLLIIAGIILILAYIDILLQECVDDVIILGEPLLAGYFYDLLQEERCDLRIRLILVPKETCFGYYVTFANKKKLLWTRSTRQSCNFRFPEPKKEEFKYVAEKYGLDEEDLIESWQTIKEECHQYPQHSLFNRHCQERQLEERKLYSYQLPSASERGKRKEEKATKIKIRSLPSGLHHFTLDGNKTIVGRMVFCINPEQEYLFRKFQDDDHPSALRLRRKYFSKTQEARDGTFICSNDDYFDYSRQEGISMVQLSTKIPLSSSYQCNEILTPSSGDLFGFSDLILTYPDIEQLYLSWKSSSVIVLDCCNIETTSSERDLIILLKTLVKMFVNKEEKRK